MHQHDWVSSTLGHGETMCSRCKTTNREAAALGILNDCPVPPPAVPAIAAEKTFMPTPEARAAFVRMSDAAANAMMEQFFAIWEAEGDPRRAGSMAAHAYIRNAARMAVFGAHCSGNDPDQDLWRACCDDAYKAALEDVATAFVEAAAGTDPAEVPTVAVSPTLVPPPVVTEKMIQSACLAGYGVGVDKDSSLYKLMKRAITAALSV